MTDLSGRELGKYQVTKRIGQGGMAEVYLGLHTHLNRKVAIKVMHGHLLEGGDFIARFKREARSVANLRHPNIVQVHDFDIEDDIIYMVMEYIEGTNLQKKIVELNREDERLPISTVGSIVNDIAEALDYAHSKGMLHRDVKPSNILLDENDKAYLTDFGIAKILSDQKFTAPGTVIGTPAYMSPEQGMGKDLTRESDIYSLGVVAFELITGQLPYDAPTPIAIVQKQISEPVPDITKLVSDVPGSAQEVIETALAKSPDRRYSSAEALVWAIRTALNALESDEKPDIGKTRVASPPEEQELEATRVAEEAPEVEETTVGRQEPGAAVEPAAEAEEQERPIPPTLIGSKPAGRIPTWGWIAGGVALVVMVAFALSQVLGGGPATSQAEPTQASQELGAETTQEASEGGLEYDGRTVVFGKPHQPEGVQVFYPAGGDADIAFVFVQGGEAWRTGGGEIIPAQDMAIADMYMIFDVEDDFLYSASPTSEVVVELEYLDEGTDQFRIEYDAVSGGPYGNGTFKESRWVEKTNSGEYRTAIFELNDANFSNRIQGGDFRLNDDADGAETIRRVRVSLPSFQSQLPIDQVLAEGEGLLYQGDSIGALKLFDLALDQGVRDEHLLHLRALAQLDLGDPGAAIDSWSQAIEQNPDNPEYWKERGFAKLHLDDVGGALEDVNRALELNPDDPAGYLVRAEIQLFQGDHEGAIEDAARALEMEPGEESHYSLLAETYRASGDPTNVPLAMEVVERGLAIFPESSHLRSLQGQIFWFDMGDQAAAQEAFDLAVEFAEPGSPRAYSDRGFFYLETGQCELAVRDYNRAIELDPGNPYHYAEQGQCYQMMGEVESARHDFEVFMEMTEGQPEFIDLRLEIQEWLEVNAE